MIGLGLLASSLLLAAGGPKAAARPAPAIELTGGQGEWRASYALPRPAERLVFARSTDDSRVKTWRPDPEFEIVRTPDGEIARRRDGRAFRSVSFRMAPLYRPLPKDYAPFSPFGDGGLLVHTGRFFACAERCPEEARWSMRLRAPGGRSILLDGRRLSGSAAWTDGDSGRNIYIGETRPVETPELLAVFDAALPPAIRLQLSEQLPAFMRQLSAKLGGPLPSRPMLFASYDLKHPGGGYGRQGGTLPGQVFTHFYGAVWPEEMSKPGFADSLAWHFAHEAAHLLQRQIFTRDDADAWIHEGGAEAFAALILRERDPAAVRSMIDKAGPKCASDRKEASVRDAIKAGRFDAAYSCGLLLNLAIDAAVRRTSPGTDGLFAVWRDYIARTEAGAPRDGEAFLAAIAQAGGPEIAQAVREAVRRPGSDLSVL